MSKDEIAPITDAEVDDILGALESFGATATRRTSLAPSQASSDARREDREGCVVLRPTFGRR